jgi:Protein of unknown function (DUF3135)
MAFNRNQTGEQNVAMQFDFDQWADLYQRDPRAFEAKRQLALAGELAKAGEAAAPVRQLLIDLENRSEGLSNRLRAQLAFDAMAVSLQELQAKLVRLNGLLKNT